MKGERKVAGLWCSEVLDLLSDYIDGELAAEAREKVDAHLEGCNGCERFGSELVSTLDLVRERVRQGESALDLRQLVLDLLQPKDD